MSAIKKLVDAMEAWRRGEGSSLRLTKAIDEFTALDREELVGELSEAIRKTGVVYATGAGIAARAVVEHLLGGNDAGN